MDMTLLRRLGLLVVLTVLLAACNGGGETRDASPTPAATQTAAPTVLQPRLRQSKKRSRRRTCTTGKCTAMRSTTWTRADLSDVMTGPRLERALTEVSDLRTQNQSREDRRRKQSRRRAGRQ